MGDAPDAGRRVMMNAFTVDLEEWFCMSSARPELRYERWDRLEPRVVASTRRLLDLLGRHRVTATFFALGWIADRYPDLVREVADGGHEIATHGYAHTMLTAMSPDEFARDLERALESTERASGRRVEGFRAPFFTVTSGTLWAIETLRSMGLLYDSSIFPFGAHPEYGIGDAPLGMFRYGNGVVELPMSCALVAGRRVPCSGGGYFRLMPYALTRKLIDRCHRQGRGVIFYIHPWELDPDQPRPGLGAVERFRHYQNLEHTERKLERLLLDYSFTSIRTLLGSLGPIARQNA